MTTIPSHNSSRVRPNKTITNMSSTVIPQSSGDQLQCPQTSHLDHTTYGPLAHVKTDESRLPAFGGEFQPGLYRSPKNRKVANPAPLGLFAFALSAFILGCIQMEVRGVNQPNIIVGTSIAYGGVVQLLAGMWYVIYQWVLRLLSTDNKT